MARAAQRLVAVGTVVACAPAVLGCGSSHPVSTDRRDTVLRVTEKDFKIIAPAVVGAGDVRLVVTNAGPDDHELEVMRAPVVGTLPIRRDGVTIDEDATEHVRLGEVEPEPSGAVSELTLHLEPGRYLLVCNMSGHYLGGMRTTVVAR